MTTKTRLRLLAVLAGLPLACTGPGIEAELDDTGAEDTTSEVPIADSVPAAEPAPAQLAFTPVAEPPEPSGDEPGDVLRAAQDVPNLPLPGDGDLDLATEEDPVVLEAFLATNGYYDHFGRSLAVGDFDGDGWDDVAVGAPFESGSSVSTALLSAGRVYVYCGGSAGLEPCAQLNQVGAVERFDRFGWALAAGDFNGDGRDDLAASAPWEGPAADDSSGAISIYHGHATSVLVADTWYDQENLGFGANEKGDRFGWALAAGNFDGDSYDDLAIGAPGEAAGSSPRSGAVFVAVGGSSGLSESNTITQSGASTMVAEERFGASLAAGEVLDGACNDCDELVVGSFNDVTIHRSGRVFVYEGTTAGPAHAQTLTQWTWDERNDDFGWALAIGDFDGNGHGDVAVGAPGENRDEGRVFIFHSDGDALSTGETLAQTSGQNPGDRFGASLAVGRLNFDGYDDLVVGAPRETGANGQARGRVSEFLGQPAGMLTWSSFPAGSLDPETGDGWFGHALAVGNFMSDSDHDLVVGAPNDDVGQPSAGAGYLYRDGFYPIARLVQEQP